MLLHYAGTYLHIQRERKRERRRQIEEDEDRILQTANRVFRTRQREMYVQERCLSIFSPEYLQEETRVSE